MENLISNSDASVLIGRMPLMSALVYITNALIAAEFRDISDEFKESCLALLNTAIVGTRGDFLVAIF